MIISASRRTDIPAFFTPWFMNRIREGFVYTRNPFNAKQVKRISLLPDDIDAIVFWTRNARPLIPYFRELDQFAYFYYFLYTITGYPAELETNTPELSEAIDTFRKASEILGPDRMIWRFDPILVSQYTPVEEILRLFRKISESLRGYSLRVIISFVHLYPKVARNLHKTNLFIQLDNVTLQYILKFMQEIAYANTLEIQSCAQNLAFGDFRLKNGSCINKDLIEKYTGKSLLQKQDTNQRKECTCEKSIDIGAYNTCLHGCSYCYATRSQNNIQKNLLRHDPENVFLISHGDGNFT